MDEIIRLDRSIWTAGTGLGALVGKQAHHGTTGRIQDVRGGPRWGG